MTSSSYFSSPTHAAPVAVVVIVIGVRTGTACLVLLSFLTHSLTRISLSLHSSHMQRRTRSTASRVAPVMMIPSPAFRRFLFHHPAFMSILRLPSCLHTATRDARLAGFPPDRPVESDQGCREEEAATGGPKRRSKGGMDRALLSPCFSLSLHGCWAARLGFLPRSPSFCLPLFPAGVGSHTITEIVI